MGSEVSVVIPVYNAEKTLVRCVESIIYGELKNIEVVLIDDCSKDDSWNTCQTLSAQYENVRCFQNEKNSGVSYTRNHGLSKVQGEYILFVDSDDWVSGKYASVLLSTAKENPDSLVICGLHFRDEVIGYKRDYLWDESENRVNYIIKEQFFDLTNKFLLQQLWNKIFRRDIIDRFQICFDETQSMGEDFQFVLDYMEAAQCSQCVVLNEPLYYYIRANSTSLMSQFGLTQHDKEYDRYVQLLLISGKNNGKVQQQYQEAIQSLKRNYIYQIMRNRGKGKSEKLLFIESVMNDGHALRYYYQQKSIIRKELLVQRYEKLRQFVPRVKDRLRREKNSVLIKKARSFLKKDDFSIISQNCIGGVFYHDMGMMFTTPTVNLFFKSEDFVRFVLNLKYYISLELKMFWDEEYPIGVLDDITIYFMHYRTCTEAKEMWDKRKARINYDKIVVFSTDMEEFSDAVYNQWKSVGYLKVLFTASKKFAKEEGSVYYSKYKKIGKVPDLISRREFYKDNYIISLLNKLK